MLIRYKKNQTTSFIGELGSLSGWWGCLSVNDRTRRNTNRILGVILETVLELTYELHPQVFIFPSKCKNTGQNSLNLAYTIKTKASAFNPATKFV